MTRRSRRSGRRSRPRGPCPTLLTSCSATRQGRSRASRTSAPTCLCKRCPEHGPEAAPEFEGRVGGHLLGDGDLEAPWQERAAWSGLRALAVVPGVPALLGEQFRGVALVNTQPLARVPRLHSRNLCSVPDLHHDGLCTMACAQRCLLGESHVRPVLPL